jgi:hypothetical protein
LTYTQDGLEYEIRLRDRERGSAVLHTVRGLDIQPQANIHKFSAEHFDTRGKCFKSNPNIRSFATFSSANLIPLHPSWAVRAFVDLE